jgi:hypothetical protein
MPENREVLRRRLALIQHEQGPAAAVAMLITAYASRYGIDPRVRSMAEGMTGQADKPTAEHTNQGKSRTTRRHEQKQEHRRWQRR